MANEEKPYEKMSPSVGPRIRDEVKKETRDLGNKLIEKYVNVGFRRADVKPVVEGGILDGLDDIHDKE